MLGLVKIRLSITRMINSKRKSKYLGNFCSSQKLKQLKIFNIKNFRK